MTDEDDVRHGTVNGYANLGCRCQRCRDANAEGMRLRREASAERGLTADDSRHGSEHAYSHYNCRCDLCRAAHAARARDMRTKVREAGLA